jgi:hypothetical protein
VTRQSDLTSARNNSHWRRWFWLFVLALMISLLWSVPASVLPRLLVVSFANQPAPVTITQTRGRLWSGEAGQLVVNLPGEAGSSQLLLENVSWRVQWSALFAGRLCLELASSSALRPFDGNACVTPAGALTVTGLVFELPASDLVSGQLQGPPLLQALSNAMQIEGQIVGQVHSLLWQGGDVQSLQADGVWSSAALVLAVADPRTARISRQPLALGELPWRLQSTQAGEFVLSMEAADTVADLQLTAQSRLWLDGRYDTDLLVAVQPTTPTFLRDLLRLMAEEDAPGVYRLNLRNI